MIFTYSMSCVKLKGVINGFNPLIQVNDFYLDAAGGNAVSINSCFNPLIQVNDFFEKDISTIQERYDSF